MIQSLYICIHLATNQWEVLGDKEQGIDVAFEVPLDIGNVDGTFCCISCDSNRPRSRQRHCCSRNNCQQKNLWNGCLSLAVCHSQLSCVCLFLLELLICCCCCVCFCHPQRSFYSKPVHPHLLKHLSWLPHLWQFPNLPRMWNWMFSSFLLLVVGLNVCYTNNYCVHNWIFLWTSQHYKYANHIVNIITWFTSFQSEPTYVMLII